MPGDFTPTTLWPCRFTCDVSTASPYVTGTAVKLATDTLWALTGRQFGLTTVTLRPTIWRQHLTPFPDAWLAMQGAQMPPLGATSYSSGWWGWEAGAGDCTSMSEVHLPAPVKTVTAVKVDGVTLAPTAYRVDDNRKLIRIDGSLWPNFNDLRFDDTQVGTWSVTATYGLGIPDGADVAIGELACEYIGALNGEDCRLPRNVASIARQGVTISMPDPSQQFSKGLTGLRITDAFILTWNPKRLRGRARAYSVDTASARRVNT